MLIDREFVLDEFGGATAAHRQVDGPVRPSAGVARLTPVAMSSVRVVEAGLWGRWQRRNREITIPYGLAGLETSGNLDNFRRLIGLSEAPFRGFSFNDTDVYKTIEAIAWSSIHTTDPVLDDFVTATSALMSKVQAEDGSLNTYIQGNPSVVPYSELAESHELYTAGHLLQAAIADYRATGQTRLLDIAIRIADQLVETFGGGRRDDYDGHPEVETALVELFRVCGRQAYLQLAAQFVDNRGRRIFHSDRRGDSYFQDREPVRTERSIVGHAVRALYLEAGVVDVAVETGDEQLLESSMVRWRDMVETKLYLTGGVGSRHKSEAFGDPYELPPDRAYCETCAAIASIHWNWRLLLATGDSRYADLLERTLYNGFAASTGLDGVSFFYSNPLQVRANHEASDQEESAQRLPWYACACCPPNIMRMFASLAHYIATTDTDGVQLHQFADVDLHLDDADRRIGLRMRTGYPWQGNVEVVVTNADERPWTLSLRVPAWAARARLLVNGTELATPTEQGYLRVHRNWEVGDTVVLDVDMPARTTVGNAKVDAIRGCVAIERGPIVYCVEAADNPGLDLAEISVDVAQPLRLLDIEDWPGVPAVVVSAVSRTLRQLDHRLYREAAREEVNETSVDVIAIPYYLWANRDSGPMRVWIPRAEQAF